MTGRKLLHPGAAAFSLLVGGAIAISGIPVLQAIPVVTPSEEFHPAFEIRMLLVDGRNPNLIADLVSSLDRCPIHDRELETVRVPIVYGLIAGSFPDARDREAFLFGQTWISGGCCLEPGFPSSARISQCGDCILARRHWILVEKAWKSPTPPRLPEFPVEELLSPPSFRPALPIERPDFPSTEAAAVAPFVPSLEHLLDED